MAYFYDRRYSVEKSFDDLGGFKVELLLEMRNALIDLGKKGQDNRLQGNIIDILNTYEIFDFPDDEVG